MMDIDRHQVRVGDEELRLTAKEFLPLRSSSSIAAGCLARPPLSDVWSYQYTAAPGRSEYT
jgi:hypothetical protein